MKNLILWCQADYHPHWGDRREGEDGPKSDGETTYGWCQQAVSPVSSVFDPGLKAESQMMCFKIIPVVLIFIG